MSSLYLAWSAGAKLYADDAVRDILAREGEPAHEHLDLRYLVVAPTGVALSPQLAELHALRWVGWDEAGALGPDHGLRRALSKARALLGS